MANGEGGSGRSLAASGDAPGWRRGRGEGGVRGSRPWEDGCRLSVLQVLSEEEEVCFLVTPLWGGFGVF